MILKRIYDKEEVKKVLNHECIRDIVGKKNAENPVVDSRVAHIAGYINNEIIGLMIYHNFMDGAACHFYVLPDFRIKYARKFCKRALAMLTIPVYAKIDFKYKATRNFALNMGFTPVEGDIMRFNK